MFLNSKKIIKLKPYGPYKEWNARLLIERSKAIKAPKIEFQLLNTKKFQQCLFEQDIIEKFIEDKDVVNSLRATFVKQFSFNKVNIPNQRK